MIVLGGGEYKLRWDGALGECGVPTAAVFAVGVTLIRKTRPGLSKYEADSPGRV